MDKLTVVKDYIKGSLETAEEYAKHDPTGSMQGYINALTNVREFIRTLEQVDKHVEAAKARV